MKGKKPQQKQAEKSPEKEKSPQKKKEDQKKITIEFQRKRR